MVFDYIFETKKWSWAQLAQKHYKNKIKTKLIGKKEDILFCIGFHIFKLYSAPLQLFTSG